MLDRRRQCESLVAGIVHLCRFEHTRETLEELVIAIVEWRTVSKALAVAVGTGDARAGEEAGAIDAGSRLAIEIDHIARLCFECAATTTGAGEELDELNEKNFRRNLPGHRRMSVALRQRFAFSQLVDRVAKKGGEEISHRVGGGGAQLGGVEGTLGGDEEGKGDGREPTVFYNEEEDDVEFVGRVGWDERLFDLYWQCVERTEFLFDDVVTSARVLGEQESVVGGAVERGDTRAQGEGTAASRAGDRTCSQNLDASEIQKKQAEALARAARSRFCSEPRCGTASTRSPRAYRSVCQVITSLRSNAEVKTRGMRARGMQDDVSEFVRCL